MKRSKLINALVTKWEAESPSYGEVCALGHMRVVLELALEKMDSVVAAFGHEDKELMMSDMRYAVQGVKNYLKVLESQCTE